MQTARDVSNEFRDLARQNSRHSPSAGLAVEFYACRSSGESRVDEGFWVAVLPFKYSRSKADLVALAEGLSEEIITGLSQFSYLQGYCPKFYSRATRDSPWMSATPEKN